MVLRPALVWVSQDGDFLRNCAQVIYAQFRSILKKLVPIRYSVYKEIS